MSLEERVGRTEDELRRQGERLAQVSTELGSVQRAVTDVGTDVKQLLAREARRPTPLTGATILVTLGSLGAAAGVVWWLIGNAPAVQELGRRMDRLDDPIVGRVPALEKRVDTLSGWGAQVVKGR